MNMAVYKKLCLKKDAVNSFLKDLAFAAKSSWPFVLFAIILIIGMAFGSSYAKDTGESVLKKMDFLFACDFKARTTEPFSTALFASFASSFIFILACFLCGLSMWGVFFIPVILFFRGFGLGLASGYLYSAYSLKGILFNLFVILPGAYICCIAIIFASIESTRFSRSLMTGKQYKIRTYIFHFSLILGVAFLSSVIDFLLSMCLSGLFSFWILNHYLYCGSIFINPCILGITVDFCCD